MGHEMKTHIGSLVAVTGILVLIGCAPADDAAPGDGAADSAASAAAAVPVDSLSVAGFSTPESVLYDEAADVYLVSNINGPGLDHDDNGFISRVSPDGTVQNLKFIDGASEAVTLNGPKGMAILGDTLFVSDIDSVRAFNRNDGTQLGARGVRGATFLNDLAVANGVLYVTDSGLKPDFSSSGTDAVYSFASGSAVSIVRGTAKLTGPNGLAAADSGLVLAPFGSKTVWKLSPQGILTKLVELPTGGLDGVARAADGGWFVSSWEGKAIYHITPQNEIHKVLENIESPADIAYDSRRGRLLIPSFNGNTVEVRKR